ncbi:MAG: hypothetical protein J6V53_02180 [Alphaproteobacteria bacterium]|nr:hypothetical protein [Alphaproteobacteria bacterium]
MKRVSFFTFITVLVLLGGYILYNKKPIAKEMSIESHETENVSRETSEKLEQVSPVIEIKEEVVLSDSSLISQLHTLIKEIRTHSMGNYADLKKEYFNYNFGSFDWDIGGINGDQFFIELKNIDKTKCERLIDAFMDAITVKVNSTVKKDCDNLNKIRFIFN